MRDESRVHIRVELEKPISDQFNSVKKGLCLKNNTEVIRTLIRDAYNRLDHANQSNIETPEAGILGVAPGE